MNRKMRKLRKMAQRHRPIAKATNPLWQSHRFAEPPMVDRLLVELAPQGGGQIVTFIETKPTAQEISTIARLRGELHAAGHPLVYPVDRATFEIIENYYKRVQDEEIAKWKAAGQPDDWPNPLWLTWTKTGNGLQFKGCELVMKLETEECLVHVPPCVRGADGLWHRPDGEQPVVIEHIEYRDRDVVTRGEKGRA